MTKAFIQRPAAASPGFALLLPFWILRGVADNAAALLSAAKNQSEAHVKTPEDAKTATLGGGSQEGSQPRKGPANKTQVQGADVGAERELPEGPKRRLAGARRGRRAQLPSVMAREPTMSKLSAAFKLLRFQWSFRRRLHLLHCDYRAPTVMTFLHGGV